VATEGDSPRLLARRSELGYVDRTAKALPDEPEAVPASYQRHLADLAHRRDRERRLAAYTITSNAIGRALDDLLSTLGGDPRIASRIRVVRRSVQEVGRELRAQ
jgi:hypothetical protein